ncbi:short chain dehydrogenase/ reductase [Xylaria bambusicola]|uniref:short chain dehydrogenase/ reductase n=1 Tax=Xylaria bambusicola TaxID=326684 RepID=UPI002008152A|nr:short chain dehydrogenase/ reductase [Xylaria bambusicola]KAI0520908.1 short chain dehydrogenase/ reductase [Xylaria bambusicola]
MPLPFLYETIVNGAPEWVPIWAREPFTLTKIVAGVVLLYLIKIYSRGATNHAGMRMNGKVVMITGGTSGIGTAVTRDLAERGAQVVLLTHLPPSNPFLADQIGELREQTKNQMIYAEQVDLSSLHSIRKFATKWIDNAPPRRLDMLILCANTLTPPGGERAETDEGIEEMWMVNYLANFHLLGILSPALRAQPVDRDVRIIIPTCSAYIASPDLGDALSKEKWSPKKAYARSKLAMMVFGQAFQKHLDAYKRPDQMPMNARVIFVDPGLTRTPGMRRWLTRGSILGLVLYILGYFLPWLFLKSEERGAQSILHAAMESSLGRGQGGKLIKECMEVDFARKDVKNEDIAKTLWEASDKLIEKTEKKQATLRAVEKKKQETQEKGKKEAEQAQEIEALVESIKKGKEAEKKPSRRQRKKANAEKAESTST